MPDCNKAMPGKKKNDMLISDSVTKEEVLALLSKRIDKLNILAAKQDVVGFISDSK